MIKPISTATVMFVDIRGFTKITTEIGSVEMFQKIHGFYDAVETAVLNHKGLIDNYMGDAVMAHFGVENTNDSDVNQAISAAMQIVALLKNESFDVGVGIATGSLAYGLLRQSDDPVDIDAARRTCIGSTVNIASRLTSLARPNQILVCEASKNLITINCHIQPMVPMKARGIEGRLNTFDIRSAASDSRVIPMIPVESQSQSGCAA